MLSPRPYNPTPIPVIDRMLAEIERLRELLEVEHFSTCSILRSDVPCDCGFADADPVAMVRHLRTKTVKARLEALQGAVAALQGVVEVMEGAI